MGQLQNIRSDFKELGYQIVALSPDSPEKVAELEKKSKFNYSLYSDVGSKAATSFGIAFKARRDRLLPVPAVFLIDQEGEILFHYVDPNYRSRIDSDTLLAAARAAKK